MSRARAAMVAAGLALACAGVMLAAGHAFAEGATPFGVGRPDAVMSAPPGGLGAFLIAEQSRFYRGLSAAIRSSKETGSIAWALIGLSLAYGVFHAAGPGHGKAIISAYLFASGETLKKGIVLAFASAAVQALAAILLVSILAAVIGATARQMDDATAWLEKASYASMAAVGTWLLARKTAELLALLSPRTSLAVAGGLHVHGPDCGHEHAPLPDASRPFGLRSAIGTVLAIGVRPCTGAIIVLVFALSQGVFATGIAATFAMALGTALTVAAIAAVAVGAKGLALRLAAPGSFAAALVLRLMEVAAALAVLTLGLALLAGAIAMPGQG